MCLLILAHRCSEDYPLVVAANRDEFHARPTAASHFWPDYPHVLAGQDLELGGTWMGVTRGGRFAAVTNFRDPARTAAAPRSRGELPLGFLTGHATPEEYLSNVANAADEYAGFNLLVGHGKELWYFDNSDGHNPAQLAAGIYGLSNARLDTPWPKVELGKRQLVQVLASASLTHDSLAAVVNDRRMAQAEALQLEEADSEMARLLSAQFIVSDVYGTRSSTTLWLHSDGDTCWREQSFDQHGNLCGEVVERFTN
ncbi:MAG: NRDE family protein [Halioglobus sp.]